MKEFSIDSEKTKDDLRWLEVPSIYNQKIYNLNIKPPLARRVYVILSLEIAITILLSTVSMFSTVISKLQANTPILPYICLVIIVLNYMLLLFYPDLAFKVPYNCLILFFDIFSKVYLIGIVYSIANKQVVIMVIILMIINIIGLTIYVQFMKQNFNVLNIIPFALLVNFFLSNIFFFYSDVVFINICFATLGVFTYTLLLVRNTKSIFNKREYNENIGDYFAASILLYVDLTFMFIFILALFKGDS